MSNHLNISTSSLTITIALNPTPSICFIIPQPKFRPIISQLVVAPIPHPDQLVVPRRSRAFARALELECHSVHVFWAWVPGVCAFGLDVEGPFFFFLALMLALVVGGGGLVGVTAKPPPAPKCVIHHAAGQAAGVMGVHVLFREMVYYVSGLRGR